MALKNNKSLGQHWLCDRDALSRIAVFAKLNSEDTVLEIGPGLGTLTSELLKGTKKVVAVEFDHELARKLPGQFPGKNLEVIAGDFLDFDLSKMPKGYKVVANVPYYITSKIVHRLMTATNKPSVVVLLVQKEVAERLAARPGDMSILSVSAQVFANVTLGDVIPAKLFVPPPKVDSRVVVFRMLPEPLISDVNQLQFFRTVKAGFSAKRKKLRSSLSGGLKMTKPEVELALKTAGISPDVRAETLSINDWISLTKVLSK